MSEWLDFVESCGLEPTGDIEFVAKKMGWWDDDYDYEHVPRRGFRHTPKKEDVKKPKIFSSFHEALEYSRSHNGAAFVRFENSDRFILKDK